MTTTDAPRRGAPRRWLARPAPWLAVPAVAALVLLAPLGLWADPLDGYAPTAEGLHGFLTRVFLVPAHFADSALQLDDFDYVAKSRTAEDLRRHLLTPHNTHVVPLFRAWAWLWAGAPASLSSLPARFALASYLAYAAALLLVGHVAAWEAGRVEVGLAAMAFAGVTALHEPTVAWFSAGQAVGSGVLVLAMLAALQAGRARGGAPWWVLGTLAALAAPLFWSGGYLAGPVGFAYLWLDGRPHCRRAAWGPLLASVAVAVGALAAAGSRIAAPGNFHGRPLSAAANPLQGALSTAQGVVEILALRPLGLAAATEPAQALALAGLLAGLWLATRRASRPNPLEGAGLVLALGSFGLVYTARGYFTFDSLRDLTWYQAVPALGGALFVAGWWLGDDGARVPPRSLARPTRGGLLAAAGVVLFALVVQTPRVRARLLVDAPPLTESERARFPTPYLQRLRARYERSDRAAYQRRCLARLDRLEAEARAAGLGRATLRGELGRTLVPGMPEDLPHFDGLNLLALPETDRSPGAPRRVPHFEPEPAPARREAAPRP